MGGKVLVAVAWQTSMAEEEGGAIRGALVVAWLGNRLGWEGGRD